MAKLTLPDVNSEFTKCPHCNTQMKINVVWYQKLAAWLLKTNQDTLSTNGQLVVAATSNTNLNFSYVGSDGVTRVANLTLV